MPDVFAWPPVSLTGHEHTISRPVQRAEGLNGAPYLSQSEPTRKLVTAQVSGIGQDAMGSGYIEVLKDLMDGKLALVRMAPCVKHFRGALGDLRGQRGPQGLQWETASDDLAWTARNGPLVWTAGSQITAQTGVDGWPYLDCSGLPGNTVIAAPSEPIKVGASASVVIRPARSDANGNARVFTKDRLPSGFVVIGEIESSVFEITEFPRSTQPMVGTYGYNFEFIERFAEDFAEGFNEVNPWIS